MATPGECIVIDNGSGTIKAGLSGEHEPRTIEEPLVVWKTDENDPSIKNSFVGSEIGFLGDGFFNKCKPTEGGIVRDWESAEALWRYVLIDSLKVKPEDHPVLITEPPLNPKINREKTAEIFMESIGCGGIYLSVPAVLSLYATGHTSGVVLDGGFGQTSIVPVFEGYQLRPGTQTLELGGAHLTQNLLSLLQQRGIPLTDTDTVKEAINTVREKLCYISDNFNVELADILRDDHHPIKTEYKLPDGGSVIMDKERIMTTESLFQPHFLGKSMSGIHVATVEGVIRCDRSIHSLLFKNVLLSGAHTCTTGLDARLMKEMTLVAPPLTKIEYIPTQARKRKLSAWNGGSILSHLDTFDDAYVKKWEYDEFGSSIVHRKCF